jgi:hypothetical protein
MSTPLERELLLAALAGKSVEEAMRGRRRIAREKAKVEKDAKEIERAQLVSSLKDKRVMAAELKLMAAEERWLVPQNKRWLLEAHEEHLAKSRARVKVLQDTCKKLQIDYAVGATNGRDPADLLEARIKHHHAKQAKIKAVREEGKKRTKKQMSYKPAIASYNRKSHTTVSSKYPTVAYVCSCFESSDIDIIQATIAIIDISASNLLAGTDSSSAGSRLEKGGEFNQVRGTC